MNKKVIDLKKASDPSTPGKVLTGPDSKPYCVAADYPTQRTDVGTSVKGTGLPSSGVQTYSADDSADRQTSKYDSAVFSSGKGSSKPQGGDVSLPN